MNLNLRNLGPLGFRGGAMSSKDSQGLLWKREGSNVFYTYGFTPNTVGVFRLSVKDAVAFVTGQVGLLPPGFCNPMGGRTITEGCEILHTGKVHSKKHLLSIMEGATKKQ